MTPIIETPRAALYHGDAANLGSIVKPRSIDALVCDPPAGIGFMGKEWDNSKGGRNEWIGWLTGIMRGAFDALKPGAHALVWALPRTSHWTGMALENAGFEIRDVIIHLFGSGFPKSLDVSKAIDDHLGRAREVLGPKKWAERHGKDNANTYGKVSRAPASAPASYDAKQWEGWGSGLKPAGEFWVLCRKPLEGTIARNLLAHGTGALNIDGCRIPGAVPNTTHGRSATAGEIYSASLNSRPPEFAPNDAGRWPANLTLSHSAECAPNACAPGCPVAILDAQSGHLHARGNVTQTAHVNKPSPVGFTAGMVRHETASALYRDGGGGASRFFYCPKASRADREFGCEGLTMRTGAELTGRKEGSAGLKHGRAGAGHTNGARNTHPTVKAQPLMRYLCRLITPPNGLVLDLFAGSGSTGIAALAEGFRFLGIEQAADYIPIADARIRRALELGPQPREEPAAPQAVAASAPPAPGPRKPRARRAAPGQLELFK